MKTWARCALLAVLWAGCGPPPVRDFYGHIPRAESESRAWEESLEACSATPAGEVRMTGTLEVAGEGWSTLLGCDSPGCCNWLGFERIELESGSTRTQVRFDESLRGRVPDVLAYGPAMDCEWSVWWRALAQTAVVLVGSFDGDVLVASEICRAAP